MTQAERTRTIKYVLAESSRWLLHRRRRDTKKINIPGCREKKSVENKTKTKKNKSMSNQLQQRGNAWQCVREYAREHARADLRTRILAVSQGGGRVADRKRSRKGIATCVRWWISNKTDSYCALVKAYTNTDGIEAGGELFNILSMTSVPPLPPPQAIHAHDLCMVWR